MGWDSLKALPEFQTEVFFSEIQRLSRGNLNVLFFSPYDLSISLKPHPIPSASTEKALRELIQTAAPMGGIMAVIVHMPDVCQLILFQIRVHPLEDVDGPAPVATGEHQQFQLLSGAFKLWKQICWTLRIRSR